MAARNEDRKSVPSCPTRLTRGAMIEGRRTHGPGAPRRRNRALLAAFFLLLAAGGPARAAFETIEVDPRLRAMGGAGTAEGYDHLSLYHNPASLVMADEFQGGLSYLEPYGQSFLKLYTAGFSAPLPSGFGGLGFGFRRFGTDYLDQSLEEQNTFSVAHGFGLYSDVSSSIAVGYGLNLYHLKYGPTITGVDPGGATSVGINVSARVTLRNRAAFGFLAQNINNPTIGEQDVEELPRRLTGGVSYQPYPGVITNLDLESVLGEKSRFHGGAEFGLNDYVDLRFGIATEPNLYSAGFGLKWQGIHLDYGFSSGPGPLEESHQIGLSLRPGSFSSENGEE